MTPYLLLLFAVVGISYVGRVSNHPLLRRLSLGVVALLLVGFAGMRDWGVGTDIETYLRGFLQADDPGFITRNTEVGYNLLAWFAATTSDSYAVLLTLIAMIVVGCYLPTIVRLVRRYEVGVFIFVCLGVYTFFFNGARQGIAAAICFAALPFLLNRKALPYFLTVGVAALFHHTALVTFPLYYLASPRLGLSRLALLTGLTVGLIAFLQVFVQLATDLVSDKYASYADQGRGGGEVFGSFLGIQGLVFVWLKGKLGAEQERFTMLLNLYLIGLVPVVASVVSNVNPSGILRFHLYFSPVAMLLWPMVFREIREPIVRTYLGFVFLMFMTSFFIMTTTSFSKLTPYRVNQELLVGW